MPAPFQTIWWIRDRRGLARFAEDGLRRAENGDWSGPTSVRARELRGWLAAHAFVEARLVGSVTQYDFSGQSALGIDPTIPGTKAETERGRIARRFRTSVHHLARLSDPEYRSVALPPAIISDVPPEETGALPALAVVAVGVAAAAAVAYVAHQTAQVVDNVLARDARARELAEKDTAALRLVENHLAREQRAGKPLDFDDSERAALDALTQAQKAIAERAPEPVESPVEAKAKTELSGGGWLLAASIGATVAAGAIAIIS